MAPGGERIAEASVEEVTNLNARWVEWETFTDGKSEQAGMSLAIVKPK